MTYEEKRAQRELKLQAACTHLSSLRRLVERTPAPNWRPPLNRLTATELDALLALLEALVDFGVLELLPQDAE